MSKLSRIDKYEILLGIILMALGIGIVYTINPVWALSMAAGGLSLLGLGMVCITYLTVDKR